jgi:hypothetical protein
MSIQPAPQAQGSALFRFRNHPGAPALNFVATDHVQFETGPAMDVRNPNSDSPSPRPIKTTNEARQGVSGQNVRTVLIVALAAIIVIFGLLWLFYFGR